MGQLPWYQATHLVFCQCRNTSGLLAGGKHYIFVGSIFHMPIGTKKQCCAKSVHLRHPSSLAKEPGRISCTALVHPAVSRQAASCSSSIDPSDQMEKLKVIAAPPTFVIVPMELLLNGSASGVVGREAVSQGNCRPTTVTTEALLRPILNQPAACSDSQFLIGDRRQAHSFMGKGARADALNLESLQAWMSSANTTQITSSASLSLPPSTMFVLSHSSPLLSWSRPINVRGVTRGCWPTASDAWSLLFIGLSLQSELNPIPQTMWAFVTVSRRLNISGPRSQASCPRLLYSSGQRGLPPP